MTGPVRSGWSFSADPPEHLLFQPVINNYSTMKKQVLMALLSASVTTASIAQYSNATLNGPWLLMDDPFDPYNGNGIYLTFDGAGSIVDGGLFACSVTGSYTVTVSGAISGVLNCDTSYPFTGQFYSQDSAEVTFTGMFTLIWERVMDLGALEGTLSGTLATQYCDTMENITLEVDQTGTITGASGFIPPVTGHVYSDEGVFVGHFFTGGSNGWRELSIRGFQTGNALTGAVSLEQDNCDGSSVLTWQAATGIADPSLQAMDMTIYPNPASTSIQVQFAEPFQGTTTVNIFDSVGKLVRSVMLQRDDQFIDISSLGNGSYLVQVIAEDRTGTQRLVVQR